MIRKTMTVEKIKEMVNNRLAKSTCTPEARMMAVSILESILHETGNYRGFEYLEGVFNENNELVSKGDESRRRYF